MTKEQADELIDMIEDFGYECYSDGPYADGRSNGTTRSFNRIKTFIDGLVNDNILTNDKN